MSHHDDNLYTILGKLAALQPTAKEKHDATVKQIYESVEAKGSVLAGVSAVEAQLNEKYMGFKNTVSALKKQGGVDNPEGLAASIGRKKYGKKKFQKAAAAGKKLGEQGVAEGTDTDPVWNQYGHYSVQDLVQEFPNLSPKDAQTIVNFAEYGWSNMPNRQEYRNQVVQRIQQAMSGQQGVAEGEKPHSVELDMIGKTRELGVQNRTKSVMAKNAQQAAEPKNAWQHTKKVIGEPLGKLARGDVKGALSENDDDLFADRKQLPPTNALQLYRWAKGRGDRRDFALMASFALHNGLTLKQALEATQYFDDESSEEWVDNDNEAIRLFNAYENIYDAWRTDPDESSTDSWEMLGEGPITDKVKKGVAAAAMVGLGATAMNPDNYNHKTPTPAQAKAQQQSAEKAKTNMPEDMSRAAKGIMKYGKKGMQALRDAEADGKPLDPVRKKYNKYDESMAEGDVVHKGRYGNDGKSYTGATGSLPKVQPDPTDTKFDTKGIAGMIGKKTGNKDIGKVSHRQKHEWDNSPEDMAEGKDPFANVDPRVSKPTIPGTKNKAKSAYYPSNKPGQVKKLDKPTSKYDNIKNESRKRQIAEGINFAEMMKDTDSSVAEMLNELQKDINSFKQTGHCSDKLEAFLKVHNHGKKLMGEAVPKGPSFAPQHGMPEKNVSPFEPSRTQGTAPGAVSRAVDIAKKGIDALTGPDDAGHLQNLKDKMYKEDAALNELARLAGLKVDESEEVCMECGMYESKCSCEKCMECGMYEAKCSCTEGNFFTKHLKDTPPGGEFEIDGKKYKDTSSLEENADYGTPVDQESNINISTNINTNGHKDVTINATGEQASELLQMLKIAGLGGSDKAQELQSLDLDGEGDELCEPGVELSIMEPEMEVDEDLANNPVEDYYSMKASTMRPGEGDFGEKNMYGGPGDNPMTQRPDRPAQPVLDLAEELAAEYESIKKQL